MRPLLFFRCRGEVANVVQKNNPPGVAVKRIRLKAGRSVQLPAGGVIWLPPEYRSVTILVAHREGDDLKHGPAPLMADD
jgi:hypothetical protein